MLTKETDSILKVALMQEDKDRKEYFEAIDWYETLSKAHRATDISSLIIERLNQNQTIWRRKGLLHALRSEYRRQNRFAEAARLLELEAQSEPDNALPLIMLAEQKMYHEDDLGGALVAVDRAVETSGRSGNFRRHGLAVKARIALALDDYRLLGQCLSDIASLRLLPNQADVGRERDFFDRADKTRLSAQVIQQFESYLSKQAQANRDAGGEMSDGEEIVPELLVTANDEVMELVRQGSTDKALELCESLVQALPANHLWRLYSLRAYVHRQGGDDDAALHWIGEAISLCASRSSLRYKRAIWLIEAEQFHEAIVDCLAGEAAELKDKSIYYLNSFRLMRGLALASLGEKREAREAVAEVPLDYRMWLAGRNLTRNSILSGE